MDNKGAFISLESIDGGGKTTNIAFIAEYLTNKGFDVVTTRDPGGTRVGEDLRQILLFKPMSPKAELLLFATIRQQLVDEIISPALEAGKVIISDRFSDSTYAYQAAGRGMEFNVAALETLVGDGLHPNFTLYLDISFEESLKRVALRTGSSVNDDKFENEVLDFKKKVHEGYLFRADMYPKRIHKIPAEGTIEEVRENIKKWLDTIFIPRYQHLIKGD